MTPLHGLGEWLRELLMAVPMPVVRMLFVLLPLAVLVWMVCLPRSATTNPDVASGWSGNLKLWAALALLIQIAIYWLV